MISRRTFSVIAIALVAATAVPVLAASTKYTPDALSSAQKSGAPILVEITAPWCPTCKAQQAVLSQLEKVDQFKGFKKIVVDFDSQKDALKTLKANMQSTLIVFKGEKEMGRLVGDAKRAAIEALMAKAL